MVYKFMRPQIKIPSAPPTIPTCLIADGVARIPIPMKILNKFTYVWMVEVPDSEGCVLAS